MEEFNKKMTLIQQVLIRTFLTLLGMITLVISVYSVSMEELKLTEDEGEPNYMLMALSAALFWAAMDLGRLSKFIDFIAIKLGFTKKE